VTGRYSAKTPITKNSVNAFEGGDTPETIVFPENRTTEGVQSGIEFPWVGHKARIVGILGELASQGVGQGSNHWSQRMSICDVIHAIRSPGNQANGNLVRFLQYLENLPLRPVYYQIAVRKRTEPVP